MDITELIGLIPAGFSAAQYNNEYLQDGSVIALYCANKHIHKYYISDIATKLEIVCPTCTFKPVAIRNQVLQIKKLVGFDFMFESNYTFYNPVYKVKLVFTAESWRRGAKGAKLAKTPDLSGSAEGDYLIISVPRDIAKLKSILYSELADWPTLTPGIRAKIWKLAPKYSEMTREPLPFSPEYAEVMTGYIGGGNLNLVNNDLCFENCSVMYRQ